MGKQDNTALALAVLGLSCFGLAWALTQLDPKTAKRMVEQLEELRQLKKVRAING